MLQILFNLVFPTACIICGKQGKDLCKKCIQNFNPAKSQNYPWVISLWDYHDPHVEQLMRSIKNYPNKRLCAIISQQTKLPLCDYLIPIPIHYTRFRERGYNQAELIAKSFPIPVITRVLYKKRTTKKQGTTKSKREREQNLKNSFDIKNMHLIKNKTIVLVDDITTTGSTLLEARNVLLQAGAKDVFAFTIAN